jgi:hypothetical protein
MPAATLDPGRSALVHLAAPAAFLRARVATPTPPLATGRTCFARSEARGAIDAGFDGVELHGAGVPAQVARRGSEVKRL